MQELTFEQVEEVNGGTIRGPFVVDQPTFPSGQQNPIIFECKEIAGQTLSPGAQAVITGIGAAAGKIHPAAGVMGAAVAQYVIADMQQDKIVCFEPDLKKEDVARIINDGISSGGPL